jgi:gas vesicle protein
MNDKLPDDKRFHIGDTEIAINPDADDSHNLDDGAVFWGAILGFMAGAIVWFFNLPRRGIITRQTLRGAGDNLRERLEATDPVTESIEEGKALARQRQQTTRSTGDS